MLTLDAAFRAFARPAQIEDAVGAYQGHRWRPGGTERRVIRAIILQMQLEQLEIMGLGDLSDGAISIQTKALLYFSDLRDGGPEGRQSFVLHDGFRYRAVATGSVLGNGNFNLYRAVRHHDAANHA